MDEEGAVGAALCTGISSPLPPSSPLVVLLTAFWSRPALMIGAEAPPEATSPVFAAIATSRLLKHFDQHTIRQFLCIDQLCQGSSQKSVRRRNDSDMTAVGVTVIGLALAKKGQARAVIKPTKSFRTAFASAVRVRVPLRRFPLLANQGCTRLTPRRSVLRSGAVPYAGVCTRPGCRARAALLRLATIP